MFGDGWPVTTSLLTNTSPTPVLLCHVPTLVNRHPRGWRGLSPPGQPNEIGPWRSVRVLVIVVALVDALGVDWAKLVALYASDAASTTAPVACKLRIPLLLVMLC